MAHEDEVQRIEAALREEDWAEQTNLEGELATWAQLAAEVNTYRLTVDDYTNDVCSRDYLAAMTARSSRGLRSAIEQRLVPIDESFREATIEDTDEQLARHYRIDAHDGWWWHRRPSAGPLATYLAGGR